MAESAEECRCLANRLMILRAGRNNGRKRFLRARRAIKKRSGPRPRRILLLPRSTLVTRPRILVARTGPSPSKLLSPFIMYESPFFRSTLWIKTLFIAGWIKATTSPTPGEVPCSGQMVTTSPSFINGDMLKPLACNVKRDPRLTTA